MTASLILPLLSELLGEVVDQDIGAFWQRVKTNLQAGRVRLVFVADVIPSELQRVVEFLNQQMDPAQVLAVEIRQYVGQGLKTLVPRVIGLTSEAEQKKSAGGSSSATEMQWDESRFFQDLTKRSGADVADVARSILAWSDKHGLRLSWGKGKKDGSFSPMLDHAVRNCWTVAVWTYGSVEMQFQHMRVGPPFDEEELRLALQERLNRIQGISIQADSLTKRPNIPLANLVDTSNLQQFLEALDWVVEQYRSS